MPKRKSDDVEVIGSKKAKLTDTTTAFKTTKKGVSTCKGKGKKNNVEAEEAPPTPRVKRINKHLKAKVKQIGDFVESTDRENSLLARSNTNENHVIVPERCLLGCLMAMRADWELTDPRMASLLDAGEAIVGQYEEEWVSSDAMVKMVVLDLEVETAFVEGIQQKIEGHGLEGINLLEVELEIYHKHAEDEAGFRLFSAVESSDQSDDSSTGTCDETDPTEMSAGIPSSEDGNVRVIDGMKASSILEKEVGRQGVCPAPMKEL